MVMHGGRQCKGRGSSAAVPASYFCTYWFSVLSSVKRTKHDMFLFCFVHALTKIAACMAVETSAFILEVFMLDSISYPEYQPIKSFPSRVHIFSASGTNILSIMQATLCHSFPDGHLC